MKRFSKALLFLLLALALAATIAVTAFATDGEAEPETIPEGAAIEYTNADGAVSYHTADELSALITAGGTVKLLKNIDTNCAPIPVKKSVTLDLNGYTLTRIAYFGNFYEATDNGDGTYTYGTEAVSTTTGGTTRDVFNIQVDNIDLTITSSNGKGTIYNINACAETYTCGDKVVKRTISSYYNSNLIYAGYENDKYLSEGIEYNISNVNLYMQSILYQSHGSAYYNITMDNVFHYLMKYTVGDSYGASYTFMLGSTQNLSINITNSIFYSPYASTNFFRFVNAGAAGKFANVKFTNCDIVKPATSYALGITTKREATSLFLFENCRIYDLNGTAEKSCYGTKGTMMPIASDAQYTPAYEAEGYKTVDLTSANAKKVSYVVPTATSFTTDTSSEIQVPNTTYETKTVTLVFRRVATKDVTVTYMKGDEVLRADTLNPGIDTLPAAPELDPYVLETDEYRNLAYQWADAPEGGKAATFELGWEDATYYAVLEIDGVKDYVKGLKGAMLNMTYMAHFAYNIYVPKVEGVEVTKIKTSKDYTTYSTVFIYGKEYYCVNGGYPTSTTAMNDTYATVYYTIDGESYASTLYYNALLYSQLSVIDSKATDIEKEAVACLMRYIHESYKFVDADKTLDDALEAKFQDFYTNYRKPADYITEYPSNELHNVDTSLITGYIESIHFTVIGSKVTFAVTLTDSAVAAKYKILFSGVGWKDNISSDGKIYYTDNRSLVDYLMTPTYTISVTDENYNYIKADTDGDGVEDTNRTVKYSMATYLYLMEQKGENVDFVKALYALGKATAQVRAQLY